MIGPRYFFARAELLRIVDGDTIDVLITWHLGFKMVASIEVRLRLARINTPETNRRAEKVAGDAAEAYLRSMLRERVMLEELDINGEPTWIPGQILAIETFKDDGLSRYVADVWEGPGQMGDDATVNDHLVDAGHAVYKTYGATVGQPRGESDEALLEFEADTIRHVFGVR